MVPNNSHVYISVEDDAKKNQLTIDGSLGLLRDLISTLSNDERPDAVERKSDRSKVAKDGSGS